eukprot:GGOE01049313.1.p1 GENE.GGOE01049313.1~~GGOE01049313.1.p1  ORF type:complete len:209 (+),score=37.67 GGOE01049313.1:62-688(+)
MASPPAPRKAPRNQPRPAIPSSTGLAVGLRPRKRVAEELEDPAHYLENGHQTPNNPPNKLPFLGAFNATIPVVDGNSQGTAEVPAPSMLQHLSKDASEAQSSCLTRYKHATLNRGQVKSVLESVLPAGAEVTPAMVVVAAGAAKVFAAQLVEEARLVQLQWNSRRHPGDDMSALEPLKPQHVMEAYRRMQQSHRVPAAPRIQPSLMLM